MELRTNDQTQGRIRTLLGSIYFKLTVIFIIVVLLMIPKSLIQELVNEREYRREEVVQEVSAKWARTQEVTGPVIVIPYEEEYKLKDDDEVLYFRTKYIKVLPETLKIAGEIVPHTLSRSLYEVLLYEGNLAIEGSFLLPDILGFEIDLQLLHPENAILMFGVNDMRGIEERMDLAFGSKNYSMDPGVPVPTFFKAGLHVKLELDMDQKKAIPFSLNLKLRGSDQLMFYPLGRVTEVELTSEWPSPSFTGAFLPDDRDVGADGFSANWSVLDLNRNFPQNWIGDSYSISGSAFGLTLLNTAGGYQKTFRSTKYALLIIGLTFLLFFFYEVIKGQRIHPMQYILVGLALTIFYFLLISLSEHIGFDKAYVVAAIGTIGLITTYMAHVFSNRFVLILLALMLIALFTYLFVLLQLETFALLVGSIGLFVILAIVMWVSRKIDWYDLRKE
jgi:inner membrane protein